MDAERNTEELDPATRERLEAARELRAALDAADERIVENPDGTLIVTLIEPIVVEAETHRRLTFGRIKVRHARAVRGAAHELEAYAEQLVSPAGALDELASELDYIACCRAAERALGKFRAAGR